MRTALIMDTSEPIRTHLFMGLPAYCGEKSVSSTSTLLLEIARQKFDLIALGPSMLGDKGLSVVLKTIRKSELNARTPIVLGVPRSMEGDLFEAALESFAYGVNETFQIEPYDLPVIQRTMSRWIKREIDNPVDAWEAALSDEGKAILENALTEGGLCKEELKMVKLTVATIYNMVEAAKIKRVEKKPEEQEEKPEEKRFYYHSLVYSWKDMWLVALNPKTTAVFRRLSALQDNPELYLHSLRVALYADCIGVNLEFGEGRRTLLWGASIAHDIGTVRIPRSVLRTPRQHSTQERHILRQHPALGERFLAAMPVPVRSGVYHHERLDGSGYPKGLSGDKIPLFARIIAVADATDGLVSDRPHRPQVPREEAVRILSQPGYDQGLVEIQCAINGWAYSPTP